MPSASVLFKAAGEAATRCPVVRRQLNLEGIGARRVEIMNDEIGNAEIHQSESDGATGAASANLHHCLTSRSVGPQNFEKTVAPAAAIKIVTGRAAIRRD